METFKTVAAFLAVFLAVPISLLQLILWIPVLRRFAQSLVHRAKEWCSMLREYKWWRKYRPVWEVVEIGEARITHTHIKEDEYQIVLQIEVKYTSRDNRYRTQINSSALILDMLNEGMGRDKHPYRLIGNTLGAEATIWDLHPLKEESRQYVFTVTLEGTPLVKDATTCEVLNMGEVQIKRLTRKRQLKGGKFPVRVVWE